MHLAVLLLLTQESIKLGDTRHLRHSCESPAKVQISMRVDENESFHTSWSFEILYNSYGKEI
jgi:hypothetical protein